MSFELGQAPGRLLLYAPNVHTGGGFVLLQALLSAWPADRPLTAWLDERARVRLSMPADQQVQWVRASIPSRLRAELGLRRKARSQDRVLCFHGLPPLLPSAAKLAVLLQNRLYLGAGSLSGFAWRTRVRLHLERGIGRWLRHRVDSYWVQTPSMAMALRTWFGEGQPEVHVKPFAAPIESPPRRGELDWDFVYVADGEAHKNHRRLIEAWILLAEQGVRPSLALTLQERDAALSEWIESQVQAHGLRVRNLGRLSHAEVAALYAKAGALVFPSLLESLGLPLLEAGAAGLPILAGELDYVRDVCTPVQSFDPGSAVSMARAVRRFLGQAEAPLVPGSAAEFLQAVMGEAA